MLKMIKDKTVHNNESILVIISSKKLKSINPTEQKKKLEIVKILK